MSEPAVCQDNIDTSYDIRHTWEFVERELSLAPCCPPGADCGVSCFNEDRSTKDVCYTEVRTVKTLERMGPGNFGNGDPWPETDNFAAAKEASVIWLLLVAGLQMLL